MITKEYSSLFVGGILLLGSVDLSIYGGNYYLTAVCLVIGMAFIIIAYDIKQKRQDMKPFIEGEMLKIQTEFSLIKKIIENMPQQSDMTIMTEQLSVLSNIPAAMDNSLDKFIKESREINDEARSEQEKIMSDIRRSHKELFDSVYKNISGTLGEVRQDLANAILNVDTALDRYLTDSKNNNDILQNKQEVFLSDIQRSHKEMFDYVQRNLSDTLEEIRKDIDKAINDADVLKNDYLIINNDIIQRQTKANEDVGNHLVTIGQDVRNKMDELLNRVQEMSDDSMAQSLKNCVKDLCDNIEENISDMDTDIRKNYTRFVNNLSNDINEIVEGISSMKQSYNDFKEHNDALIKAFSKMSEEDAKIIRSILPSKK